MRLFVCTFLNAANQGDYGRRMADLIAGSGGILRGIPPQSAHITYAFLPRADDRVLADTTDAVTLVASRHDAIAIRLGAPYVMYARTEARLVCAPIVQGERELSRLTAEIVRELERRLSSTNTSATASASGSARDSGSASANVSPSPSVSVSGSRSPHVTLARFGRQTHRRAAAAIADALARTPAQAAEREDRVAAVQVVSSELTSAGPRYEVKAAVPLRNA